MSQSIRPPEPTNMRSSDLRFSLQSNPNMRSILQSEKNSEKFTEEMNTDIKNVTPNIHDDLIGKEQELNECHHQNLKSQVKFNPKQSKRASNLNTEVDVDRRVEVQKQTTIAQPAQAMPKKPQEVTFNGLS